MVHLFSEWAEGVSSVSSDAVVHGDIPKCCLPSTGMGVWGPLSVGAGPKGEGPRAVVGSGACRSWGVAWSAIWGVGWAAACSHG